MILAIGVVLFDEIAYREQMKMDQMKVRESEADRAEAHEMENIPLRGSDHDSDVDPAEAPGVKIALRRVSESEYVRGPVETGTVPP